VRRQTGEIGASVRTGALFPENPGRGLRFIRLKFRHNHNPDQVPLLHDETMKLFLITQK
jgi:hypothetical protein